MIVYAETVPDKTFDTYRNLPAGSTAVPKGPSPASGKGEPGIAVKAPLVALTLYAEMEPGGQVAHGDSFET